MSGLGAVSKSLLMIAEVTLTLELENTLLKGRLLSL